MFAPRADQWTVPWQKRTWHTYRADSIVETGLGRAALATEETVHGRSGAACNESLWYYVLAKDTGAATTAAAGDSVEFVRPKGAHEATMEVLFR